MLAYSLVWYRCLPDELSRETINKIVYKIFGAMSKDLYNEISAHFGIESVENFVANRRNRFINRYGETDNYYL